eukprot:12149436-Alexandrium_andersonii.AAC.1
MGKRKRWCAKSALAFLAWCFDTRSAQPDAIVHECTSDFDTHYLELLFIGMYILQTLVFTPVDVGYPASRPRRYTLLLHRRRCMPTIPYTLNGFGSLLWRSCQCNGSVFFCAPADVLAKLYEELA